MKHINNPPLNVVKNTTFSQKSRPLRRFSAQKLREFLIFLLPACLFMSSYPQITFGETDSMYLELSLPEIWLVLFSVASLSNLPQIWRDKRLRKLFLVTAIFPVYALISLLWSSNPLRGLLTAGVLTLIWFSVWNIVLTLKNSGKSQSTDVLSASGSAATVGKSQPANLTSRPSGLSLNAGASPNLLYRNKLQTVILATSVIFAAICWLQCLLDLFGAGRDTSLLCLGCTSESFGFPHPNGLTLEPQFMGNLLLAPAFYTLNLYLKARDLSRVETSFSPLNIKHSPASYLALFAFFSATLFLTFSRGAIYAFVVAFVARIIVETVRRAQASKQALRQSQISRQASERFQASKQITNKVKRFQFGPSLLTILTLILSFVFTLSMQGVFAEFGPTSDTFISATTKSIHHLSLGKLDFRPEELKNSSQSDPIPVNSSSDTSNPASASSSSDIFDLDNASTSVPSEPLEPSASTSDLQTSKTAIFSGYVAESTDIRTDLTEKALDIWGGSPENAVFGTGFGSAGQELYANFPETGTSKEIVQNEYTSLLLELGSVGYLCLFISLSPFLKATFLSAKNSFSENRKTMSSAQAGALTSLEFAYLLTLCFFSGLPNALHIYLFPPLLRTPISKN